MDTFWHNLVSVLLLFLAIGWTIFTIFSSWGTACFDIGKAYGTIFVFILELVWNNFIKPSVED